MRRARPAVSAKKCACEQMFVGKRGPETHFCGVASEGTDFEDTDYSAARQRSSGGRAPTREDLDAQLTGTQQQLAKLRETQEQLERTRTALEEMRRRRAEFSIGLDETRAHLIRGTGLLEKAEFEARRDAEQLSRTLEGLRGALASLEPLTEKAWSDQNWEQELTRALTVIENARMEHNGARLKWPVLDGKTAEGSAPVEAPQKLSFTTLPTGQLCRLGFALTWPLALVALVASVLGLVLLARR